MTKYGGLFSGSNSLGWAVPEGGAGGAGVLSSSRGICPSPPGAWGGNFAAALTAAGASAGPAGAEGAPPGLVVLRELGAGGAPGGGAGGPRRAGRRGGGGGGAGPAGFYSPVQVPPPRRGVSARR